MRIFQFMRNCAFPLLLLILSGSILTAQPKKNTLLVGTVQPMNAEYGVELHSQGGHTSMYVEGLGFVTFYEQPFLESGNFPDNAYFLYESLSRGSNIFQPLGNKGVGVTTYDAIGTDSYTGSYPVEGGASCLTVQGDYAYVAGGGGLGIYDLSGGGFEQLGETGTDGTPVYAAVSMSFVFLASLQAGVSFVDISDPQNPLYAGAFDTPGEASGLAVDFPNLYIADGSAGIIIVDMTDPTNMKVLSHYDTPGYAQGIDAADNFLYVADGNKGLRIIDMTDKQNPVETGWYETPFRAASVDVYRNLAFVGDGSGRMVIIKNMLY